MNIAFFLTPKSDVIYLETTTSVKQALATMEQYSYTAIPIVDETGKYFGTLTEGDLLWAIKNSYSKLGSKIEDIYKIKIKNIKRHRQNNTVSISADMDNLIQLAAVQNFVPVSDDQGAFIGIIKRSDIINYIYKLAKSNRVSIKNILGVIG